MKTVSLSGSSRKNVGKKDATLLRREERVPAVLYGGKEQTHFHVKENDAKKLYFTPSVNIIELDIDGTKKKAIIQEVQQHPVTDRITHIDFMEVIEGRPLKIKLPVATEGHSIGIRNGGRLRQNFRGLAVSGLEADLPENIVLDITNLRIGSKIRVSEINIKGLKFLDPASAVVVAVQMARGAIDEEEEEEEGAEGAEGAEATEGTEAAAE